ncbi:MAG: hypothetical protein ACO1OF_16255 [Adhaeribacter sp.]
MVEKSKILLMYDEDFYSTAKEVTGILYFDNPTTSLPINVYDHTGLNDNIFEKFEIVTFLLMEKSLDDSVVLQRLDYFIKLYHRKPNNLIIPIIGGESVTNSLFSKIPFSDPEIFDINDDGPELSSKISNTIKSRIKNYFTEKDYIQRKAEEIKQHIEKSAAEHLTPISDELKEREKSLEKSATIWFWAGYLSLASALGAPFIVKYFSGDLSNYPALIYYSVKSLVFVLLAISLSKYASNLARAFMNESRKVADRRHAISFGEFALKVSSEPIQIPELKELFKEWNISGNSSFLPGTTDDHDPKLMDKIKEIILAIKGK